MLRPHSLRYLPYWLLLFGGVAALLFFLAKLGASLRCAGWYYAGVAVLNLVLVPTTYLLRHAYGSWQLAHPRPGCPLPAGNE